RREVRVVDGSLVGRHAPVAIRAFQFVLIAQYLARVEFESREVDAYPILIGTEPERPNLALAEFRDGRRRPRNAQALNQNRRLKLYPVLLGDEARQLAVIAEPERAALITIRPPHPPREQSVGLRIVFDTTC